MHQGCLRLCCLPDNLLLPIMSSLIWEASKAFCEQMLSLRVLQGSGCAHVVVKVLQRGCKLAQQLFLAGCVWVASGESSAWAKCLLQQGRRVVDHFFVQVVCRPGLETFAAVSCLQFVVGKTSFVPEMLTNIILC